VQAANKITAIVTAYMEKFSIYKAPVFLSYYVFTASITHVSIRKQLLDATWDPVLWLTSPC
jgi:hypothetical protein